MIPSFKELIVWQRAVELAHATYVSTSKMPREEVFGLQSQMRRAAVSIPSNIAEGKKRGTRKDFLQFLRVADGSAAELETQIIIAEKTFTQIDFELVKKLLDEVQRMLAVLIKKVRSL